MRALSAWSGALNVRGNYPDALELGKKFAQISGADDHVANRTLGYTAHFLGDMQGARRHLEAALGGVPRTGQVRTSGAHYDQNNATLRAFLARTLWLAGYADRGVRMAHDCVQRGPIGGSCDFALHYIDRLGLSACISDWRENCCRTLSRSPQTHSRQTRFRLLSAVGRGPGHRDADTRRTSRRRSRRKLSSACANPTERSAYRDPGRVWRRFDGALDHRQGGEWIWRLVHG